MLKKDIRKKLIEVKENKNRLLVEQTIVKNRIIAIFGSEKNIKNFNSLSESKKRQIGRSLSREILILKNNGLLNESSFSLTGIFKNLFGNAFSSVIETMVEPFVNSILTGLGLSGFFKNFLVSILTTNPTKLMDAWGNCRVMTNLVAQGISEALAMQVQEKLGASSPGYSILRNLLGKTFKEQEFVTSLSKQIEDVVCGVFNKIAGNAEKVVDKLQTDANPVS
jgi:hypothetical protein